MGKISPVSSKYVINATIEIEGVVDRPDVIGAIFGQTEGLLGADLELRELQRSGRIGRIEVNTETRNGKTAGAIIIPSSMDKAETAIVGASLEVIQRIGPCNAKVRVKGIEDVRISKRQFVVERAKELLRTLQDTVMPDSQEIADEVAQAVRVEEIAEYGTERLPAGPGIDEAEEVIIVEGRADVLNLLKAGFKNAIAMNGTSCPQTIINLTKGKDTVVFVDGDRGGDLIIKELLEVAEIDFVTKAPDGKEVEELAKKEIHKALRSRITAEQAKLELASVDTSKSIRKPMIGRDERPRGGFNRDERPRSERNERGPRDERRGPPAPAPSGPVTAANDAEKAKFSEMLEGLIGTRGAMLLDQKLAVLGKVPTTELATTLNSLKGGVYAVVFDGVAENDLVNVAQSAGVRHLVAMDSKVKDARLDILTAASL